MIAAMLALLPRPGTWKRHALILAAELQRVRIDRVSARRLIIEAQAMLADAEAIEGQIAWERERSEWRRRAEIWLS